TGVKSALASRPGGHRATRGRGLFPGAPAPGLPPAKLDFRGFASPTAPPRSKPGRFFAPERGARAADLRLARPDWAFGCFGSRRGMLLSLKPATRERGARIERSSAGRRQP